MNLTEKLKDRIDKMAYGHMLHEWRFSPIGAPAFQGEAGKYFQTVMHEKSKNVNKVLESKNVGWDKQ